MTDTLLYVTFLLHMETVSADDERTDAVFQALAHAARRRMLDIVSRHPGISVGQLAAAFDVSRIAVMKHLGVLEHAGLLRSLKQGRQRKLYFNAVPIQAIHQRWTNSYSAYWSGQLLQIKDRAEARTAPKHQGEQTDHGQEDS